MAEAAVQKCPNCERAHDVSVYVTGQKVRCICGIRFEVKREVKLSLPPGSRVSGGRGFEPTTVRVSGEIPAHAPPLDADAPAPAAKPPTKPERGGAPVPLAATAVFKHVEIKGYEMIELLGKGGMGEVWKARQVSLGRTVAIKVLSPEFARDPEFVQRFEKEATALAALSHPNIVQIIERGNDSLAHTYYFAMELCEGSSLRDLMTAGALTVAQRLDLVLQICRAVDYAHGRGVIHRDLKPENILVDAQKKAKVVDFGLAGMRRTSSLQLNLTRAATAMGTLHYMAPEQRRDARSVDERADIYSLGVMLYEILVGEVPMGRFKLPSERLLGLDARLDAIVSKSLEPEPAARYASVKEMTLQLEAVAAEAPQVVPGPALAPAATPTKVVPDVRYKVARYVAAATVLACGALGVGTLLAPAKKPLPPAAASPSPVDTDADVPVSVTRTGEDYLQILVDFKPGQGVFHAGSGEWKLDRGALVGRVFGAPRSGSSRPFAVLETPVLLAEGLNLDTTVTVDPTPPVGYTPVESPSMEVLLRGEGGGKLGLTAVFGPKGGFALALRPPEGETVEERRTLAEGDRLAILPVAGKPLHLRLSAVGKGEIEIFAGAEEPLPLVFKKKLSVRDLSGKVALSCGEATCRFTRLEVVGRLARLPKPPAAVDPVP